MRMSRERIFHLTDLIVKELESSPARAGEERPTSCGPRSCARSPRSRSSRRSIDTEVRKILGSYSRHMPEGSREWEVLYQKTREEVFRRRFRL